MAVKLFMMFKKTPNLKKKSVLGEKFRTREGLRNKKLLGVARETERGRGREGW